MKEYNKGMSYVLTGVFLLFLLGFTQDYWSVFFPMHCATPFNEPPMISLLCQFAVMMPYIIAGMWIILGVLYLIGLMNEESK